MVAPQIALNAERKALKAAKRIEFESCLDKAGHKEKDPWPFSGMALASRGRDALHLIIEKMALPRGAGVLLPALACPEVYRPFLDRGQRPCFYRVGRDLRPDMDQVECLRKGCSTILVINYYGFVQPMEVYDQLRAWGLTVIEDGSHSALSAGSGCGGHAYFASLRKLLPLPDGAAYRVEGGPPGNGPRAKQGSLQVYRLARLTAIWLKRFEQKKARNGRQKAIRELFWEAEKHLGRFGTPTPAWALSRSLMAGLDLARISEKRRRNYQMLAGMLDGIKGVDVLFPTLTEGAVPYGLPVLVKERARCVRELDRLNVQAAPLWSLSAGVPDRTGADREFHDDIMLLPVGQDYGAGDMAELADRIRRCRWA